MVGLEAVVDGLANVVCMGPSLVIGGDEAPIEGGVVHAPEESGSNF
jgi:hypothetical protein